MSAPSKSVEDCLPRAPPVTHPVPENLECAETPGFASYCSAAIALASESQRDAGISVSPLTGSRALYSRLTSASISRVASWRSSGSTRPSVYWTASD